MEKINISDNDLKGFNSLLEKDDRRFYLVDGELFKIYNDLKLDENRQYRLQIKTELLQQLKDIEGLVIPKRQIFYNGDFVGFTQTFYEKSISLSSYDVTSNQEYIEILKTISNLLKQLHERNVVWGDLSFDNILIDDDGIKFIDLEGCGIGLFEPDYYSRLAYDFSMNNSLSNGVITTKEFDKLSLFIEFMCYHFLSSNFTNDYVIGIKKDDYECFCVNINLELKKYLNIARNYFKIRNFIKRKNLPYLGDIINCDIYEDRIKRLELRKGCLQYWLQNGLFYD